MGLRGGGKAVGEQQPQHASPLISQEIPGIQHGSRFPNRGEHLPNQAAKKQWGDGLFPGADGWQVPKPQEEVGPCSQGQPGKEVIGVAGEKPAQPALDGGAQPQAVDPIE